MDPGCWEGLPRTFAEGGEAGSVGRGAPKKLGSAGGDVVSGLGERLDRGHGAEGGRPGCPRGDQDRGADRLRPLGG